MSQRRSSSYWPWVPDVIALIVTICWALGFIADIFVTAYDPPPYIHVGLVGLLGAYHGVRLVKLNGGPPG